MSVNDLRGLRFPAHQALSIALTVIALFWGSLALAQPGDYEIHAFGNNNYWDGPMVFKLTPGQSQDEVPRYNDKPIASLKVGKKVGILLSRSVAAGPNYPEYIVVTEDTPSLHERFNKRIGSYILFDKGEPRGVSAQGRKLWSRMHPDGVTFAKNGWSTLSGSNVDVPFSFYLTGSTYDGNSLGSLGQYDLHWARLYGKATYLKIHDRFNREFLFTTKGQDMAEYNLESHEGFKNRTAMEVGIRKIEIVPDPLGGAPSPETRARWEYQNIRFKQFTNGRWVEFQNDQPVFSFEEVTRMGDYVELLDKGRNIRVRLHPDHASLLRPAAGPNYAAVYSGGGWRDSRDYWVMVPGRYFKNTSGKTWDEFGGERKVFTFTETRRTADFVEFYDTSRNLWIRLHADRAVVLRKDDPTQQWGPLASGQWAMEEAPKMTVAGGPPPSTPPPALPGSPGAPGSGLLPPVLPSSSPNLTGPWTSNFGMTYQIQQTGPNFTWTAPMLKEMGQGKFLSKNEITAQWSGPGGNGSAKGNITQTDSAGKPTRIEWSHGIVFTRK